MVCGAERKDCSWKYVAPAGLWIILSIQLRTASSAIDKALSGHCLSLLNFNIKHHSPERTLSSAKDLALGQQCNWYSPSGQWFCKFKSSRSWKDVIISQGRSPWTTKYPANEALQGRHISAGGWSDYPADMRINNSYFKKSGDTKLLFKLLLVIQKDEE